MKTIRIILGTLLAIICLNAFGGGYYGIAGAKDVPLEWLEGSPFKSYFLPSLFLFVVVGGACLIGTLMAFRNSKHLGNMAFFCSALLLSWILVQLMVIGYVSWLQPAILISAVIIFGLAYFLKDNRNKSIGRAKL